MQMFPDFKCFQSSFWWLIHPSNIQSSFWWLIWDLTWSWSPSASLRWFCRWESQVVFCPADGSWRADTPRSWTAAWALHWLRSLRSPPLEAGAWTPGDIRGQRDVEPQHERILNDKAAGVESFLNSCMRSGIQRIALPVASQTACWDWPPVCPCHHNTDSSLLIT